ncbi:hypothetical protein L3Y34_016940 [Caenorhabditis briggsae]|uniref:Galectin n=1 Tax=Caenorhabditis briggsae TaxID=6238 RepID=A0AAE9DGC2_CAEBR|nr:hypothetical protein L3Y34_016940 [Caenorhabditis briggsae]
MMIVYNTFISNEDQGFWDTQDIRFVPLKQASKIEMEIKVDESALEILINQKYIMYFSHRIVPSEEAWIIVSGKSEILYFLTENDYDEQSNDLETDNEPFENVLE